MAVPRKRLMRLRWRLLCKAQYARRSADSPRLSTSLRASGAARAYQRAADAILRAMEGVT